jgi:CBS domain-containing protein
MGVSDYKEEAELVRVLEIMSSPVTTVRPEMTLKDAARLLVDRDISAAPVVDQDGQLVGMLGEADVMTIELHEDPRRHVSPEIGRVGDVPSRVEEVMSTDVLALPSDADVADVAKIMLQRRIRSVPIVDGAVLQGIVSRRDVLRVLLRSDADMKRDLDAVLNDLPSSLGVWSVRVEEGVVRWIGSGPKDVHLFLTRIAFTVPGVVDVRFE